MPELKGRTLEEIDELFVNNVPAWQFKTYQTTIQDEALAEVRRREEQGKGAGVLGLEEDEKNQKEEKDVQAEEAIVEHVDRGGTKIES